MLVAQMMRYGNGAYYPNDATTAPITGPVIR